MSIRSKIKIAISLTFMLTWTIVNQIWEEIMGDVAKNKAAIAANQKKIYELAAEVMTNKTMIYTSRSMIEENRLMILSNYSAAFMGNRQLANSNTDEIFDNRQAILDNAETENEVEENFINSQKNKNLVYIHSHNEKFYNRKRYKSFNEAFS